MATFSMAAIEGNGHAQLSTELPNPSLEFTPGHDDYSHIYVRISTSLESASDLPHSGDERLCGNAVHALARRQAATLRFLAAAARARAVPSDISQRVVERLGHNLLASPGAAALIVVGFYSTLRGAASALINVSGAAFSMMTEGKR
jgi:hypothetical protein